MQVVAHNLLSQFSSRQLNITSKEKGKSEEKLSSGYRINRSADDASGLQISEKLRWQTRGLKRASDNIQDGISLIQVADGALNESHAVLQRMRELSVQAANDSNTDADRGALQKEIDELIKEVDRIANDTSFNSDIYPLKAGGVSGSVFNTVTLTVLNDIGSDVFCNGSTICSNGDSITINGVLVHNGFMRFEISGRFYGGSLHYREDMPYDDTITSTTIDRIFSGNTSYPTYGSSYSFDYITLNDVKVDDNGYLYVSNWFDNHIGVVGDGGREYFTKTGFLTHFNNYAQPTVEEAEEKGCLKSINVNNESNANIWIQMGAQNGQGMFLTLVDATAKGVGITDPSLDITSYEKAGTSISRLDKAIDKVSFYRSTFGAQQNRLEYAKSVDDNTAENTQSAESKIRDADMAQEMVQYSKHNILEQAGQAMLAQANQSTQGILTLLQ